MGISAGVGVRTAAVAPSNERCYLRLALDVDLELVLEMTAAGTAAHQAALKEQARRAEIRRRIAAVRRAYLDWACEHPDRANGCTSPR